MDVADAAFAGVSLAVLASTGLMVRSVFGPDAPAPGSNSGIGRSGLGSFVTRDANEDGEDDSILNKIVAARSTSAPGFTFEVTDEAEEGEDSQGASMAEAQAVARARAEQQEARQKKSDALAAAIEREDYSAAAALKKELDELG